MLHVAGTEGSPEYQAARELASLILRAWPGVADSATDELNLIANVQCHGQIPRDIDLIVLGLFGRGFPARYRPADRTLADIAVHSLCLAIEIKDHDPSRVRFSGTRCEVAYSGQWHDAGNQSHRQCFSIVRYLGQHGLPAPWVSNLIWLRGVSDADLPARPHNLIGAGADWLQFLDATIDGRRIWLDRNGASHFHAFDQAAQLSFRAMVDLFRRPLQPSPLDRRKLDHIGRRLLNSQQYHEKLGRQLLIFRGRGGTGKTVHLLRLAQDLYTLHGARVLLLTYNTALTADIRRLLALMNIAESVGEPTIQIRTIHSFLYSLFIGLGIMNPKAEDFIQACDAYKQLALQLTEGLDRPGIARLLPADKADLLGWDYILIDEAQDWPEDERDLLFRLFDPLRFILADGVDQYVRGTESTRWDRAVPSARRQIVPLRRSLRVKSTICRFVNSFADAAGLQEFDLEPNPEIEGGRIRILVGRLSRRVDVFDAIYREALSHGNEPIEILLCVPPRLARPRPGADDSLIAAYLKQRGYEVWDGTHRDRRRQHYPTSLNELRIVQYDSSRGLEGWAVVCLALDDFFAYKKDLFLRQRGSADDTLIDVEFAASLFAVRWCMIPLTRAVDTLVLHIHGWDSQLGRMLKDVARRRPDSVDIVEL